MGQCWEGLAAHQHPELQQQHQELNSNLNSNLLPLGTVCGDVQLALLSQQQQLQLQLHAAGRPAVSQPQQPCMLTAWLERRHRHREQILLNRSTHLGEENMLMREPGLVVSAAAVGAHKAYNNELLSREATAVKAMLSSTAARLIGPSAAAAGPSGLSAAAAGPSAAGPLQQPFPYSRSPAAGPLQQQWQHPHHHSNPLRQHLLPFSSEAEDASYQASLGRFVGSVGGDGLIAASSWLGSRELHQVTADTGPCASNSLASYNDFGGLGPTGLMPSALAGRRHGATLYRFSGQPSTSTAEVAAASAPADALWLLLPPRGGTLSGGTLGVSAAGIGSSPRCAGGTGLLHSEERPDATASTAAAAAAALSGSHQASGASRLGKREPPPNSGSWAKLPATMTCKVGGTWGRGGPP